MTKPKIPKKRCAGACKELKPATAENFHKNKSSKAGDGLGNVCKPCALAYVAEYRTRPEVQKREAVRSKLRSKERRDEFLIMPTLEQLAKMDDPSLTPTQKYRRSLKGRRQTRERNLRAKYAMTIDQFHELYKTQRKRCAICREKFQGYESIHVDHCHETGKVRGLLCKNCNLGLGLLRDSPPILLQALRYIRKFLKLHNR